MQQTSTTTLTPPPATPARPWEEILRDVQRAWSEAYSPEGAMPPRIAPVPVPTPRPPGC